MSIFEALILGIVQGLTEFIPVSSSGHLLLTHEIFGSLNDSLAFDVALHVGTLLALLLFFRRDILKLSSSIVSKTAEGRLVRLLLLATIPAGVAGLLLADFIDDHVRNVLVVAVSMGLFGLVMLISDGFAAKKPVSEISTKQGLIVGLVQTLALVPGVSRSGATMTAGLFAGLERKQAARFSFLLAIPIIAGSALGILMKNNDALDFGAPLVVGMLAAFASGLFAIKFMLNVIARWGLKPFAYYRMLLAVLTIVFMVWL